MIGRISGVVAGSIVRGIGNRSTHTAASKIAAQNVKPIVQRFAEKASKVSLADIGLVSGVAAANITALLVIGSIWDKEATKQSDAIKKGVHYSPNFW